MNESLEYAKALIEKAEHLVSRGEEELKKGVSIPYSNVISWCQRAIELSGKAIFKIMGLDFPKEHQLLFEKKKKAKEEKRGDIEPVKKLLQKVQEEFPGYLRLDKAILRVIFLTYFWYNFHTIATYGVNDISPDEFFHREDAELALKHAKDCLSDVNRLLYSKKGEGDVLQRN